MIKQPLVFCFLISTSEFEHTGVSFRPTLKKLKCNDNSNNNNNKIPSPFFLAHNAVQS